MSKTGTTLGDVQTRMMDALFEKGPEHFLTWISGWYSEVAEAKVSLDLAHALGELASKPEVVDAYIAEKLPALAAYSDNGNGSGSSVLERAVIAAYAKRLRQIPQRNARAHLDTVLEQVKSKLPA